MAAFGTAASACDRGRRRPASNVAFWNAKLAENRARDRRNEQKLRALGWEVAVVWECETVAGRLDAAIERLLSREPPITGMTLAKN